MSENRQAINNIIGSLSTLDSKIGNITQVLERKFFMLVNYSLILTIRICYSVNKKNYFTGLYLNGTYTVKIKDVIFRSSFTCSYNPKRFEENPY